MARFSLILTHPYQTTSICAHVAVRGGDYPVTARDISDVMTSIIFKLRSVVTEPVTDVAVAVGARRRPQARPQSDDRIPVAPDGKGFYTAPPSLVDAPPALLTPLGNVVVSGATITVYHEAC